MFGVGDVSDYRPSALNVAIVNDVGSKRGIHCGSGCILDAGVPVNPVEELVLNGTHDGVVACRMQYASEGHVRVQRSVAGCKPGIERWGELRTGRRAVGFDEEVQIPTGQRGLGATVSQVARVTGN
jgi:hypothetical protein